MSFAILKDLQSSLCIKYKIKILKPLFLAFISSLICFNPLAVIESGNSASPLSLDKVTFFTSIKILHLFFIIKKSNLVLEPNLVSGFIKSTLLNSFIKLLLRA